jgi:hypothetical protein
MDSDSYKIKNQETINALIEKAKATQIKISDAASEQPQALQQKLQEGEPSITLQRNPNGTFCSLFDLVRASGNMVVVRKWLEYAYEKLPVAKEDQTTSIVDKKAALLNAVPEINGGLSDLYDRNKGLIAKKGAHKLYKKSEPDFNQCVAEYISSLFPIFCVQAIAYDSTLGNFATFLSSMCNSYNLKIIAKFKEAGLQPLETSFIDLSKTANYEESLITKDWRPQSIHSTDPLSERLRDAIALFVGVPVETLTHLTGMTLYSFFLDQVIETSSKLSDETLSLTGLQAERVRSYLLGNLSYKGIAEKEAPPNQKPKSGSAIRSNVTIGLKKILARDDIEGELKLLLDGMLEAAKGEGSKLFRTELNESWLGSAASRSIAARSGDSPDRPPKS